MPQDWFIVFSICFTFFSSLPQFVFNTRDPIVVGVVVESGIIKEGKLLIFIIIIGTHRGDIFLGCLGTMTLSLFCCFSVAGTPLCVPSKEVRKRARTNTVVINFCTSKSKIRFIYIGFPIKLWPYFLQLLSS